MFGVTIHSCLMTYDLKFMVHGESVEVIIPQMELRHWDQTFPYLFIIVADILSHQVNRALEVDSLYNIKMA